jgi:hypothetical protein
MTKEEFISHLVDKNEFKLLAPHTLLYKDDVDTIVVYVTDIWVIITADGPQVINSVSECYVGFDTPNLSPWSWEDVLQEVLNKF